MCDVNFFFNGKLDNFVQNEIYHHSEAISFGLGYHRFHLLIGI